MNLRDYQLHSVNRVLEELASNASTLLVLPTGCGKTVVFASITQQWKPGRVLVLAHREELVRQAADKIQTVTGEQADIEMASDRADLHMFRRSKVVVASVQTLIAKKRMEKFDPKAFGLIITDEAHHAIADSYGQVYRYFQSGNPDIKHLGVTATPDRTDEAALGRVFASVSHVYELADAIDDGWLCPIRQRSIRIDSLDYSGVRVTAGDLNQGDVAKVQRSEETLQGFCTAIAKEAKWRKTIIFATPGSLKGDDGDKLHIAERMTEILNRIKPNGARRVSQDTPKDERRQVLRDYTAGKFQFLVNVGVFTEGFDEPGVELVAITRPTTSRALFAQMIGRGTRALPGIVDGPPTAHERKAAIARSKKPYVEVLDFAGNAGKHKLVSVADILGGNYDDDVVERAKVEAEKEADETGKAVDPAAKLEQAKESIHAEREEEKRRQEEKRRAIVAKSQYTSEDVSPFDVLDIEPPREHHIEKAFSASDKQIELLRKWKVPIPSGGFSKKVASALIGECFDRRNKGLCTYAQAQHLKKHGLDPNMRFDEAKVHLDALFGGRKKETAQ